MSYSSSNSSHKEALRLLMKRYQPQKAVITVCDWFRYLGCGEVEKLINSCGKILRFHDERYNFSWSPTLSDDGKIELMVYTAVFKGQLMIVEINRRIPEFALAHDFLVRMEKTPHVGKLCTSWAETVLIPALKTQISILDQLAAVSKVGALTDSAFEALAENFAKFSQVSFMPKDLERFNAEKRSDVEVLVAICHVARIIGVSFRNSKEDIWVTGLDTIAAKYPNLKGYWATAEWPIVERLYLSSLGKEWLEAVYGVGPGSHTGMLAKKIFYA